MRRRARGGFTLLEMIIVVTILVILAGTIVSMLETTQDGALIDATRSELATLRDACMRWKSDVGLYPQAPVPTGATPIGADANDSPLYDLTLTLPTLLSVNDQNELTNRGLGSGTGSLFVPLAWNPVTRRGWRGPYVQSLRAVGPPQAPLGNLMDPWGRVYAYQHQNPADPTSPIQITSAGPDGVFNTSDDLFVVLAP